MLVYFKHLAKSISANIISTNTFFSKAVIGIITFYAPVILYAFAIVGLIVIDVITGIWASLKKGEKFQSRVFRKGLLEKIALYGMLFTGTIIMGKVLQSVLHYQTFYLAWLFTILISVYELSSIIENIITIKPEYSFLNKIKAMLTKVEDKQLQKLEDKLSGEAKEDKKD